MGKQSWESIGGCTHAQFPMAGKDWTGPADCQAILSDDDTIKAMRGVFTCPDGSQRLAEVRYLSRTTKHTFRPLTPPQGGDR